MGCFFGDISSGCGFVGPAPSLNSVGSSLLSVALSSADCSVVLAFAALASLLCSAFPAQVMLPKAVKPPSLLPQDVGSSRGVSDFAAGFWSVLLATEGTVTLICQEACCCWLVSSVGCRSVLIKVIWICSALPVGYLFLHSSSDAGDVFWGRS